MKVTFTISVDVNPLEGYDLIKESCDSVSAELKEHFIETYSQDDVEVDWTTTL